MNRRDDLENPLGVDEDAEILMRMLRNDQVFIVSLVGESGAGKNTVAKIIRREMAMSPEMELFVWYHMEPGCTAGSLIRHLVRCAEVYYYGHRRRGSVSTRPWPNDEYNSEGSTTTCILSYR
jgi:hypothetical protein